MDIEANITKLSNLECDDSISCFQGHGAQQFHGAYNVFYNLLKEVKPVRILEIGTASGGFTVFLKICCDDLGLKTDIRSYEIEARVWYPDIIARGIDIRLENIFSEDWKTINNEVIDYIQGPGTTIILCDGGWKIGEVNVLSNYIKEGDFILAHDYAESRDIFEERIKKRVWNWIEITESDIADTCEKNGLVIYEKETFENVAWTCRRKIIKENKLIDVI